jgi:hypothetical protein
MAPNDVYNLILQYLEDGNYKAAARECLLGNLEQFSRMVSWELNEENLKLLWTCVNRSSTLDDDMLFETQNVFITEAFKDLSSLRNPHAMSVFAKLRAICVANNGEILLWGRKVTKRTDGSAVMVLHVSNLEAFEKMLHRETGHGFLQEGLMIYR